MCASKSVRLGKKLTRPLSKLPKSGVVLMLMKLLIQKRSLRLPSVLCGPQHRPHLGLLTRLPRHWQPIPRKDLTQPRRARGAGAEAVQQAVHQAVQQAAKEGAGDVDAGEL